MITSAVPAALYLDFDNVFTSLRKLDPAAAQAFVDDPGGWLERLARGWLGSPRWLALRCYLNPAGWPGPDSQAGISYSRFRGSFVDAGFEVVDCPRLGGTKNAADIRIVIDVLDGLAANPSPEEVVIISGDSDMTPLLLKLRAAGRRTTLVTPLETTPALRAVADRFVTGDDVVSLARRPAPRQPEIATPPGMNAGPSPAPGFHRMTRLIVAELAKAKAPLPLSSLGQYLRQELAGEVGIGTWFGHGTLSNAIRAASVSRAQISDNHLWDATRHKAPAVLPRRAVELRKVG